MKATETRHRPSAECRVYFEIDAEGDTLSNYTTRWARGEYVKLPYEFIPDHGNVFYVWHFGEQKWLLRSVFVKGKKVKADGSIGMKDGSRSYFDADQLDELDPETPDWLREVVINCKPMWTIEGTVTR